MGAVGDPSQQLHDWEPGIAPSGLFWTIPMAAGTMSADPGAGVARFVADGLSIEDYGNFFNAISASPDPPPRPSLVSFDVRWAPSGARQRIRDSEFGFVADLVPGTATISFTARDDDSSIVYTSVADAQTTVGAGVGHERNGVFFS